MKLKTFLYSLFLCSCIVTGLGTCSLYSAQTQPMAAGPNMVPGMPEMSEEQFEKELEEALKFLSTLSEDELEELEKIGREILESEGIDPDTLEPMAAGPQEEAETEDAPVEQAPSTEKAAGPAISSKQKTSIINMISQLIYHTESLLQKASTQQASFSAIKSWEQDIQNIIGLLLIINKSKHVARLADPKYTQILQILQNLHNTMRAHEPQLATSSSVTKGDQDNPYEILDVANNAAQKDIDEKYEKLSEAYDTKTLRQELEKEKLPEKDIKRKIKQKQLDFQLIEDAYERISDPKARKQVDRQLQSEQQRLADLEEKNKKHTEAITTALSDAIYNKNAVGLLEQFLKEYEPEELAKKKRREEQEKAHMKEQRALSQQAPMRSPSVKDPQYKTPTSRFGQSPDFYNDPFSFDPDQFEKDWDDIFGSTPSTPKSIPTSKKPSSKESAKKDSKEGDAEKQKKTADLARVRKETKSVGKLLDSIEKSFSNFSTLYNKPPYKEFFRDLPAYTHGTTTKDIEETPTETKQKSTEIQKQKDSEIESMEKDFGEFWKSVEGEPEEVEEKQEEPSEKPSKAKAPAKKKSLDTMGPDDLQQTLVTFVEKTNLKDLMLDLDDLNKKLKKTSSGQKKKQKNRWDKIVKQEKETIGSLQKQLELSIMPKYKGAGLNKQNIKKLGIGDELNRFDYLGSTLEKIHDVTISIGKRFKEK